MEAPEITQEATAQLQQIHRWLDESTLEEIQESCQPRQWAGSSLQRTLNINKFRNRQQQRREQHHGQTMMETPEGLMAASHENTVKAVTQWLTWITKVEMQQALRKQLEHPNKQYHLYLAVNSNTTTAR
jgi:hypothetical protein